MRLTVGVLAIGALCLPGTLSAQTASAPSDHRALIGRYCVTCHNERLETAGLNLDLDGLDVTAIAEHPEVWEKVVRKLRTGTMPPPTRPQPPAAARDALASWLETSLDAEARSHPNPGRTDTLRRLNRTEYQNAVRDLLALDIDAASLLPPEESGYGFDNVTVSDLSPVLLDRYISAAQKISRLAVGSTQTALQSEVIRVASDVTQEAHMPGLPIGTRGGTVVPFTFAQDGEYDIQIRLARNLVGDVGGLRERRAHLLDVFLDRERVKTFTVEKPPDGDDHSLVDEHLKIRIPVTAGPHDLRVAFQKRSSSLPVSERKPLQSRFNEKRHPRSTPAVQEISILGPYSPRGAGDTPSRRRIFVCEPADSSQRAEETCATDILSTLVRRAYRRTVSGADIESMMAYYRAGRSESDFDTGIGKALTAVLMNPAFLFRVELDPEQTAAGSAYRVSDVELASRLSFFLWSSLPDDELLEVAIRGDLSRPGELERQARRMLEDPRSHNLASNFAGQWLLLRNLGSVNPNVRLYPDFDDNLRQAFREETERFFDSVLREDRSVLDLLKADYTFLNERLAKHSSARRLPSTRRARIITWEQPPTRSPRSRWVRTHSCRRWSCRWTWTVSPARATTAMPASTRLPCPGRHQRPRFPRKRIPGSSSSVSLARAVRRPSGGPRSQTGPVSSTRSVRTSVV